jgi:uncharacterized protein (DUF1810 family)
MPGLERFIEAQDHNYQLALAEVRSGKKQSHWVWYIFPQMRGLGRSYFAQLYGISDREEAVAYLNHEVLGPRLREITSALLDHVDYSAEEIFGDLDAMKVRSCMTLFDIVSPDDIFVDLLSFCWIPGSSALGALYVLRSDDMPRSSIFVFHSRV